MTVRFSHHHVRRGFSFIEVILYIALVSVIATVLLSFTLEIAEMASKDRSARTVFSDARNMNERLRFLIRNADGVDEAASVFSDPNGRLVLKKVGSSGTMTLSVVAGKLILEDGSETAALNGSGSQVRSLTFEKSHAPDGRSEFIGFQLNLGDATQAPGFFATETTLRSGAEINSVQ